MYYLINFSTQHRESTLWKWLYIRHYHHNWCQVYSTSFFSWHPPAEPETFTCKSASQKTNSMGLSQVERTRLNIQAVFPFILELEHGEHVVGAQFIYAYTCACTCGTTKTLRRKTILCPDQSGCGRNKCNVRNRFYKWMRTELVQIVRLERILYYTFMYVPSPSVHPNLPRSCHEHDICMPSPVPIKRPLGILLYIR